MDWSGLGLKDSVLNWLRAAADERYIRDRRLDPFATSMRDFDDVTPNLRELSKGKTLSVRDSRQRITDLKAAGLVDTSGASLTDLGKAVLAGWEKYGIATDEKDDELARLLVLALEAQRLNEPTYAEYFDYWKDLRAFFDPMQLINSWDALYALNYLDFDRGGFAPGTTFRDEGTPVTEVEFDLVEFARNFGSKKSVEGAERIEDAIGGKIPRGRHRSTMCMAFEICAGGTKSASLILDQFGFPKKPRVWTPFSAAQRETIESIISDYAIGVGAGGEIKITSSRENASAPTVDVADEDVSAGTSAPPTLPESIDFSKVLVDAPALKAPASTKSRKPSGAKVDHLERSKANDAVGKLGETFALRYEKWRLRDHPDLLKKIHHVSTEDDTTGYDIASFELDGTPRYVEVKGTLGPLQSRFFLSANEMACAKQNGAQYVLLRVANLAQDPTCCEIRYPFDGKLSLTPATYSVSFSEDNEDT